MSDSVHPIYCVKNSTQVASVGYLLLLGIPVRHRRGIFDHLLEALMSSEMGWQRRLLPGQQIGHAEMEMWELKEFGQLDGLGHGNHNRGGAIGDREDM